ncbi:MAG TPA: PP2C family protein-serine/threonine phosphatase, partial [Polyangiaceae bacterium]|nr:PP2C family protein-serine/threonine phosphatase [Polyangiaceae bacterium]
GFDWRRSTAASLDDPNAPRGRGIALARKLAFDSLDYFGSGNRLAARVDFDRLVVSTSLVPSMRFDRAVAHDRFVSQDLPEAERAHIQREAQLVQSQKSADQLLHEEALLAAKLLGGRKACIGLLTPDGCLEAFVVDTCGEREVQMFSSADKLPEVWSRVLSLEAYLIINEPRSVAALGLVQQSVLVPIRHRLAVIGFLHVAENGADWTQLDALRLAELAQHFAPLFAARTVAEVAARQARTAAAEQARALEDQEAARYLVGCLLREGCMAEPGIRHYATSLEVFNGDIALAARTPKGALRWMLGDFVGHGLSAAIGGIPLASIFYATARKGVPLIEVVVTMNQMLRDVLPPGYFCAAILLELGDGQLSYWNGGMPPGLLRSSVNHDVRELPSGDFPLGIVGEESLELSLQTLTVHEGDRVLCYSDGLIEARSPDGILFGVERAIRAYADADAEDAFEHLSSTLAEFRGVADASDDLSIVEITVGLADRGAPEEWSQAQRSTRGG